MPSDILGIEGELVGIIGFALAGLSAAGSPDQPPADGRRSRVFTWISVGIIAYMIALTAIGYLVDPAA